MNIDHLVSIESTATTDQVPGQNNGIQTWKETANAESMYKAALEGDWVAAEVVLARDSSLAYDQITEEGDRALHVAAARRHEEFVQKLVEKMSPTELELLDGHGYTACCYAAIAGAVEIAHEMVKKNPNLGTARDKNGETPLHKAIMHGNADLAWCFMKCSKVEDFSREEWFDLLLHIIRSKMYDVGLELLEKDGSVATLRNEQGTALHELARQDIEDVNKPSRWRARFLDLFGKHANLLRRWIFGYMQPDHRLLSEKLCVEIKKLDRNSVVELMKNPPILHDATKVGNLELIITLISIYPNLIWETDSNGYTMFHIAVIYRQEDIFVLIHDTGAIKHFIAISEDINGNNILHLAAQLAHPNARKIGIESTIEMQREMEWFKEVEAIVPPLCREMRNKDGYTPQELFSKEHKSLQEKGELWMRNAARSCMLVATILLTLVFAAAFQVPGGNNQDTGIPVHLEMKWFTCFIVFEAVALCTSTFSIIVFWSIMTSSFEQDQFMLILPNLLKLGLTNLFLSLVASVSAFMATYFLVFVGERGRLVKVVIFLFYFLLSLAVYYQFDKVRLKTVLPASLFQNPMWRSRKKFKS